MAKLNLIIADYDENYIRGLSEYINSNHSVSFAVNCFTKADSFIRYLKEEPSADILVVSPDFYDISTPLSQVNLKVLLSPGALSREYPDFKVISKYSTGEKLLGEVLHLYSKSNPKEIRTPSYSKSTVIIGVYSPAGGTGKTTIATALSRQIAELGMESFYLNLESIQSTGVFFNLFGTRNLSYVFYYIKEKSTNLSFKMDGIKNTEGGVHYFNPPESPAEYEEINAEELQQLICGIKETGCYDYVFIDMSSAFDMKNNRIMNLCDLIVLVTLQDIISMHKNKVVLNELVKAGDTNKSNISDKFIVVVNKYKDKSCKDSECFMEDDASAVKIPEYSRALIKEDGRLAIDDSDFEKGIGRLIGIITGK